MTNSFSLKSATWLSWDTLSDWVIQNVNYILLLESVSKGSSAHKSLKNILDKNADIDFSENSLIWSFQIVQGGFSFPSVYQNSALYPYFLIITSYLRNFMLLMQCYLRIPHRGQASICIWQYSNICTSRQVCSKFCKSFFLLYTLLFVLWDGCLRTSSDYHVNTEVKYLKHACS